MDRISNLPDYLLHHILSFLPVTDVIATCLLSRRWRHLWKSIPIVKFEQDELAEVSQISTFIYFFLMRYEGPKIQKFSLELEARELTKYDVDSWMHVAMRHKVEDIAFEIMDENWIIWKDPVMHYYVVPNCLFRCEELKELRLARGELKLPSSFHFCRLKKIILVCMQLPDLDFSACPLLETLSISCCNIHDRLNIHAPNRSLRKMDIIEHANVCNAASSLELYAPHVLFVTFQGSLRRTYIVKNLFSILNASFYFHGFADMFQYVDDDTDALRLMGLLENFSHAKTIELCQWCIQVLSYRDAKGLATPQLGVSSLVLRTNLNKLELPGLTCMLRNCPSLESLVIDIVGKEDHADIWKFLPDYCFEDNRIVVLLELALSARSNLKTVEIKNFLGSKWLPFAFEPTIDLRKIFEDTEMDIKLAKILLQCCNKLDKLIIRIMEVLVASYPPFNCRDITNSPLRAKLLDSLTRKLLAFPKASVNAKIYVS